MSRSDVIKTVLGSLLVIMLLAACGSAPTATEEDTPPAVLEARSWLADQLDVPEDEITIISSEQVDWTDSCYGLGGPAESCLAAITPGWRAEFEVAGERYEVRFDETGTIARSPQIS